MQPNMSMQSQSHWLCLKKHTNVGDWAAFLGVVWRNGIIISIGAILPAKSERTHVRKQPCVPNTQCVLPGDTTGRNRHRQIGIHLSTSHSPLKSCKRNFSVWNIHLLVCSAPAKAIYFGMSFTIRYELYHKVPPPPSMHSRDPQGCRAALGAGASCIGQKQQPNVLGGVCLCFPDVQLDGTVWICHCGHLILGLWFWDFIPHDHDHAFSWWQNLFSAHLECSHS